MMTDPTPEDVQPVDHLSFRRIAQITLGLVVVLVILVPVAVRSASNAASGVDAIQAGNEVSACRSVVAAQVARAQTDLDVARDERDQFNSNLLQAALSGNRALTAALIADPKQGAAAVATAVHRATRAKDKATDRQVSASQRSVTHPTEFLAECRGKR